MIHELKKLFVTNAELIGIFESENTDEEYLAKISFNRKRRYCSCPDFLYGNDLKRYFERKTYLCKHVLFLELILLRPNLAEKLYYLGKISTNDYYRLLGIYGYVSNVLNNFYK